MDDLLAGYPVILSFDIAWGEMDAFRHVNNIIYFRYFESGRVKYLDDAGAMAEMERSGIGPILHSIGCRFRFPLTYPDRIHVGVRVTEMGVDRFTVHHRIVSDRHGRIAAEGDGIVVMFDYNRNQKAPVPAFVREAITRLEGWNTG